jgi:hypothetical protein
MIKQTRNRIKYRHVCQNTYYTSKYIWFIVNEFEINEYYFGIDIISIMCDLILFKRTL